MADIEHFADEERKVVQEFCYLLEKSKQLFNGLRDLPQYGHKQWQSYFGRTFDVYTKLWKFQQQNRQVLDTRYGLKRWQIGEIASKIGQLYYHYYLRTSETNYLNESFSFYSAIRARAYYSKANKEGPELCVKKLRYYARFVVVCLLLRKIGLVRELIQELNKQIEEYTSLYEPDDQLEWQLVLGEIRSFIEAEQIISVIDTDTKPVVLSHRLSKDGVPALERGQQAYLTLQEALIIGNCNEQIKFSELTLDMYRILQALEREPKSDDIHQHHHNDSSPAPGQQPVENGDRTGKRENPHKYLLYKPTFGQLFTFLSAGFKELPPNAALLIYLSADGSIGSERPEDEGAYDYGGVVTNSRREPGEPVQMKRSHLLKEMHCLHPGDLYPFSRKPLFLVVDSSNSVVFKNVPNLFGQPVVCLMSPTTLPKNLQDQNTKGNLFTLFLYSPLTAFCHVCDIGDIPVSLWEKCQKHVNMVIQEVATLISKSRSLDHHYMQFYGDEFLRLLMLRFVVCYVTLRYHRGFKDDTYYPQCHPEMKGCEILENASLHKWILELASMLDVRALFLEVSELE